MLSRVQTVSLKIRAAVEHLFTGPQALALLPALVLAGFWLGGETILIALAIALPLCLALLRSLGPVRDPVSAEDDVDGSERLTRHLDGTLRLARRKSLKCATVFVELDDYDSLLDRYGHAAAGHVIAHSISRLQSALRSRDKVFHIRDGRFAIAVAPVRRLDMDVALQVSERLQRAVEEPISLDATTIYVSASCGMALSSQIDGTVGRDLANAAGLALRDARRYAPSAIRAYSPDMHLPEPNTPGIENEVTDALEAGQIVPWFQPQISTDTGHITGFEALARWIHPERGLISPAEFLPTLERASKLERLGEVILYQALRALAAWDNEGLNIPKVGVNFSPEELRNPRLVEKIKWELDRFELTPDRLMVEILETVVATSPDDTITRNINALANLGCSVDLDDFGTGHASISSIRRFAIERLKIDRSFVMKVDVDSEQQRMVSAILMMAERLGLDTLAEGVETAGEHAMLAQLGCNHVQGFGISRPLPFDKTADWVRAHIAKLGDPPVIGRKMG